jgi:threonine dehydrogenase-like Zn-dependent dehydrogenase
LFKPEKLKKLRFKRNKIGVYMKALIYKNPYLMEIEEIEKPLLDDGEVLVRVEAVGACGSDVHGFAGKTGRRYPGMVMGHEISGVVEDISNNVPKSLLGESVVIQPIISCGSCKLCKLGLTSVCLNKKMVGVNMGVNGGLSEYLKVPYQNALKINKNVSPQVAAMVEPFAVGEGAVSLLDDSLTDKNVCIVGAGTIGLTTLFMTLKRKPKKVFIVDQNVRKLEIAESFGAIPINFLTENPKEVIFNQTDGLGVDVVFEAVGVSSSNILSITHYRNSITKIKHLF